MQPVAELLGSLRQRQVRLWLVGDTIRFQGPPGAVGATELAELKARKPEVVAALAAERPRALAPLPSAERPRRIPLSVSQQIWFDPDYMPPELRRTPVCFRLVGPFSLPALIEAFRRVIGRHEILRTRYGVENGEGYQEVLDDGGARLSRTDLMDHPPEQFRAIISRFLREEYVRPPERGEGRPLCAHLFRLRPNIRVMTLLVDHIALDNRSMNIILRELFSHYRVVAEGETDTLPSIDFQYADYAIWAQELQSPERVRRNECAWRHRIGDATPISLRSDHARLPPGESARSHERIEIDDKLSQAVYAFAKQHGYTVPIVLVAVAGALLAAWAGRSQVLIGYVVDGRPPKMRDSVGAFARTSPLFLDLTGDPPIPELLARARRAYLEANNRDEIVLPKAFPGLAHVTLNIQKKPDQALFQPQEESAETEALAGGSSPPQRPRRKLEVQSWRWSGKLIDRCGVDLHIYFVERPNSLLGYVLYDAERMDRDEVRRFTQGAPRLLEAMVATPDARLSDLIAPLNLTAKSAC